MEKMEKIIISDPFLRKSFDVYNLISLNYEAKNIIVFCNRNENLIDKIKLNLFYPNSNIIFQNNNQIDKYGFLELSKKFNDSSLVYLPIEEKTTLNFLNFIGEHGKKNFKYLLPSHSNFSLSRNKKALNIFCEEKNISCPKYYSESDILNNRFTYPIIKKPSIGSGAKGIVYIHNTEQLNKCKVDFKKEFFQKLLENPKNIQAGFFLCKEGKVLSFYSHKRIRTYPETGGVSVYSKSDYNIEIKKLGSKIIKQLNWSGFIMIEFLYDSHKEKFNLIEINPRLWGSVLLSELCNANFIHSYVNSCLGKSIKSDKISTNKYIRWVFPYDIFFCIKKLSNPFVFLKKQKNTCYINFSFSSNWRSVCFLVFSIFNFNNLKKIFS